MYNTASGIFQAVGDSRHPLYYLIFSSVLNVILELLFVAVFQWGIAGAGAPYGYCTVCQCIFGIWKIDENERCISGFVKRNRI